MKSFLARNSERNYSEYWFKAGELSTVNKDICEFVDNNAAGTSPVVSDNNVFYAARIMATAQIPDSAYVRHILLQNGMENKADSLLNLLSRERASPILPPRSQQTAEAPLTVSRAISAG